MSIQKGRSLLPARMHARKTAEPTSTGFWRGIPAGLGASSITALCLLLLSAIIAYASPDPDALIAPLGFAGMILSCLAGGMGVGIGCRSGVLPCALLCSCAYLGLSLLLGLFFGGELRQSLTLGLGLGASLGIRAGLVALFCAAALLTAQVKDKFTNRPHGNRRHH